MKPSMIRDGAFSVHERPATNVYVLDHLIGSEESWCVMTPHTVRLRGASKDPSDVP